MIKFHKKDTVLTFHKDHLDHYCDKTGIRDEKLLESAYAQAEASFGGDYVHRDIFHMAAAYGFHLCQNHPVYDGNNRTALMAIYTFLYVNGYQIIADKKSLFAIMIDAAKGKVSKDELREYLEKKSIKREKLI